MERDSDAAREKGVWGLTEGRPASRCGSMGVETVRRSARPCSIMSIGTALDKISKERNPPSGARPRRSRAFRRACLVRVLLRCARRSCPRRFLAASAPIGQTCHSITARHRRRPRVGEHYLRRSNRQPNSRPDPKRVHSGPLNLHKASKASRAVLPHCHSLAGFCNFERRGTAGQALAVFPILIGTGPVAPAAGRAHKDDADPPSFRRGSDG